ncbi:unnamed protein product [Chrysoparadoxa australica]
MDSKEEKLSWTTMRPGDATNFPQAGNTVSVHYKASLAEDGTVFDNSRDRKRQLQFKVGAGQVLPAWEEVIPKISLGQIVEVKAAPEHCYGMAGYPPIVPPNATLVFEIELISFN